MTTEKIEEILVDPLEYIPRFFKVLTKEGQLVPMHLKPTQEFYLKNRTHRDIICKPRQVFMSTGVMAANAHILFTTPYMRMALITHHDDVSQFLFQTVHRFYNNLPAEMRPEADWSSGSRIRFPAKTRGGGKGLDSLIHIDSAESKSIGFGETLNHAHLSEVCRWPESKAVELYTGITQTVSPSGYITIESNPRGRGGLFYRLYDAAKRGDIDYKTFFFPWWWNLDYKTEITGQIKLTQEEQLLSNANNLTPEQITWRRGKIAELGDLFYQEYPENDIDCWLSSEISVFDGVAIRRYLQQIQPGRTEGHLTTWKDVIGGERYVIGADPAGGLEKGDYSAACVLRVRTNEYVARIRGKLPPDLFAQELLRLANHYNQATIGVERLMHGHTVLHILLEANYPNIYHHLDYDNLMEETIGQPGWKTSGKTKPIMIDTMAAALRSNDIMIWSENFLMEASGYLWEGQKTKKAPGGYDDELDALMIAVQLREETPILELKRYGVQSYASIGGR